MNNSRMDKRGHVPTFLLLIGAIVLVVSALFSFAIFENNSEELSSEISDMVREVEFKQAYVEKILELAVNEAVLEAEEQDFVESFKRKFLSEVASRNPGDDRFGNFFVKIERGEFGVYEEPEREGVYSIEIREIFVDSAFGVNEMRRYFNLEARFNKEGILDDANP